MIIPITDPAAIPLAVEAISRGELIVVPTDTVYGVACTPFSDAAIARLYEAKNRPQEKAIQVLLSDIGAASLVAKSVPSLAQAFADRFWPGALTLTLPKREDLPPNLSRYETVGVRIPNHDRLRELIRAVGGALATTSANYSGGANPTTVQAAAQALGDAVPLYLDDGPMAGDQASTVIDLHDDTYTLLRQGQITQAMLDEALSAWKSQA